MQKKRYQAHSEQKKEAEKKRYRFKSEKKKTAERSRYEIHRSNILSNRRQAYYHERASKLVRRASQMTKTARTKHSRYSLKEPKRDVQELYVKNMKQKVAHNASLRKKGFKKSQPALSEKLKPKRLSMAVVSIGVRRVLNTALKKRKANAGEFLACIRAVNEIQLSEDDFGEQYHTLSSEPYFYDESYAQTKRKTATPIDDNGRCVVAEEVG